MHVYKVNGAMRKLLLSMRESNKIKINIFTIHVLVLHLLDLIVICLIYNLKVSKFAAVNIILL